jgi:arginyl-tRNA synthetase
VYKTVEDRIRKALRHHIHERYKVDVPIVLERPPRLAMGEVASPLCFELAKQLKKPPRALAQEIANSLKPIEGVARIEVAGGGYLNAFLDRAAFFRAACQESGDAIAAPARASTPAAGKIMVEHTSINPNKAAHIGHLRNAVLGDAYARILRQTGRPVEVQNYIDNTGVQVADVVLGFTHIEKKSLADVQKLIEAPRFDYLCWDLYARVTQFFAEDKGRLELRSQTLKEIEEGHGEAAAMAEVVSTAIVHCHLRTLNRLGIGYDLLSRESEILRLKFWDAAFQMLKESGAIQFANTGKNAGCWVMELQSDKAAAESAETAESTDEEPAELADAKIIVRSNGTVTYVGKDIAYHLWKFGLLGRDFHYRRFPEASAGHEPWVTTSEAGESGAPAFGHARDVVNVIDSRQAYPQQVVVAGLRALGYGEEADRLKHFSYNVVALTPRCAAELGYEIPPEDAKRAYVEVSGRKGQGVKADDLIDQLEARAAEEIEKRHPELVGTDEFRSMVDSISIGALRYFLLRFTRPTAIAFDFKDALSFEGETGPYLQYAVVRVNGIVRKGADREQGDAANLARLESGEIDTARFLGAPEGDDLWDLILLAGSLDARVEIARGSQEPAFLARYAFELAQAFNVFYHKHHILSEENADKRAFLLRITQLVKDRLVGALDLLGITAPERM